MIYTETKNYIFSEIGKRVKKNKKEHGFTYYQLAGYQNKADYEAHQKDSTQDSKMDKQLRYGKFDYSIITNIAGGKAYPGKNPYLISDTLLLHLTEKLKFSNELELLWGDFENGDFSMILFEKLLLDVLNGSDEKSKEIFNNVLTDYVPYAEYHSYWQMFVVGDIEMPKIDNTSYPISSYFYRLKEDDIFEQYEIIQKNAIEFLYYKFDIQINQLIQNFIREEGDSLTKLDKRLGHLVLQITDFFLKNMPKEDSLGLRARNIITSDYKKFGTLIAKEMKGEQMELNEFTLKYLVEASLAYITGLKRVQVIELEVIKGYKFTGK
ncbi:hypothetical protein ACTXLQ_08590 [Enterococcus hirae]|uniref:hypothetical protein n=1 Tax=Enterococcus TaxID=1350 RepID=UPI001A09373E|nr:hypothetical protein [Enterococcus hirae]EMF0388721.1 hypothetical protein [Enterococcus hirae]EMF0391406.1 hypothetical protein [Enterococcus hirae]